MTGKFAGNVFHFAWVLLLSVCNVLVGMCRVRVYTYLVCGTVFIGLRVLLKLTTHPVYTASRLGTTLHFNPSPLFSQSLSLSLCFSHVPPRPPNTVRRGRSNPRTAGFCHVEIPAFPLRSTSSHFLYHGSSLFLALFLTHTHTHTQSHAHTGLFHTIRYTQSNIRLPSIQ